MIYTTEAALKAAHPDWTASELDRRCGPLYDLNSTALQRHRRKARNGLASPPREERDAYAAAVEAAIHQSNNAWLAPNRGVDGHIVPDMHGKPYSGAQRLAALNTQLLNYPSQVRRQRTEKQWRDMYEAAMKEKRLLNSTTTTEAAANFLKVRNASLILKDVPICQSSISSHSPMTVTASRNSSRRQAKPKTPSSAPSKPLAKLAQSRSTSTGRKVSSTSGAVPPDVAAKRSAAAYKAHETRRRMKAEAEAQARGCR